MMELSFIKKATIYNTPYLALFIVFAALTFCLRRRLLPSRNVFQLRRGSFSRTHSAQSSKYDAAEKGSASLERDLWTNAELFELEKRAILSKNWFFVSHRSRFEKAGDYHTFSIGEVSFFVILGKDLKLRAFHNVCRHRAYTVVRKQCGSSLRLSCKYHGWQYESTGALIKAPKFEDEEAFKMEENGLFEIQLRVSNAGSIFVNFESVNVGDTSNGASVADGGADSGMEGSQWVEGWEFEANVNWKLGSCGIQHSKSWDEERGWSPKQIVRRLRSHFRRIPDYLRLDLLTTVRRVDDKSFRVVTLFPLSAAKTLVKCSIYSHNGQGVQNDESMRLKRQIRLEFAELEKAQMLLKSGLSDAAEAQIANEGNLKDIMAALVKHQEAERVARKRMYPASRSANKNSLDDEEAMHVFESLEGLTPTLLELECPVKERFGGKLDW